MSVLAGFLDVCRNRKTGVQWNKYSKKVSIIVTVFELTFPICVCVDLAQGCFIKLTQKKIKKIKK